MESGHNSGIPISLERLSEPWRSFLKTPYSCTNSYSRIAHNRQHIETSDIRRLKHYNTNVEK